MITLFENYIKKQKPDVESVNPELWKMIKIADWDKVIKGYKKHPILGSNLRKDFFKQSQFRIYSKYSFQEIHNFYIEYHNFYMQVYHYFEDIWLDPKYSDIMPSDDGYTDLISSVIGKGKEFTKKCIDNTDIFIKTAKNDDYVENFGYMLQIDENDYWEIRTLFDPLIRDTRKFNI